jgi:hypothetical protein
LAELRRDLARLRFVMDEIKAIETTRLDALLAAPDRGTAQGRRDYALLLFLYNACRCAKICLAWESGCRWSRLNSWTGVCSRDVCDRCKMNGNYWHRWVRARRLENAATVMPKPGRRFVEH